MKKKTKQELTKKIGNNGKCPFLKKPFDDCYCTDFTTLKRWAVLQYCNSKLFRKCEIYRYNTEWDSSI